MSTAHARVVDVEERLQVGEHVGARCTASDVGVRQRDAVAPGELEHQLGLERALDVEVQLGLGQHGRLDHALDPPTASGRGDIVRLASTLR